MPSSQNKDVIIIIIIYVSNLLDCGSGLRANDKRKLFCQPRCLISLGRSNEFEIRNI